MACGWRAPKLNSANSSTLLRIPVEATWCAADIVSSDDPLFVGRPGSLAGRGANFALQNCDFLLSIGARLDFAITGYAPDKLARAAHKVMVDIDEAEIRKLAPHIHTPIVRRCRRFSARTPAPERRHRTERARRVERALRRLENALPGGPARAPQARRIGQHLSPGRSDFAGNRAGRSHDFRQRRQRHRDLSLCLPHAHGPAYLPHGRLGCYGLRGFRQASECAWRAVAGARSVWMAMAGSNSTCRNWQRFAISTCPSNFSS